MANKYIDTTATFNGDGTSSAQATVDGGAGAWNSFQAVLSNTMTYGSYAGGDTIYVRTHDGTSNITESVTTTTTAAPIGNQENPVTYIFDNGDIWATGGTFKFAVSGVQVGLNIDNGIRFIATKTSDTVYGFHYEHTYVGHKHPTIDVGKSYWEGCYIEAPYTGTYVSRIECAPSSLFTLKKCKIDLNNSFTDPQYSGFTILSSCFISVEDTIIDLNRVLTSTAVQSDISWGSTLKYTGCKFTNTPVGLPLLESSPSASVSTNIGTMYVQDSDLGNIDIEKNASGAQGVLFSVIESGCFSQFSSTKYDSRGLSRWVDGANYPTQSALLPDGKSWSLKVRPGNVNSGKPFINNYTRHFYNGSSSILTITQELVIKDTSSGSGAFDNPLKSEWYMSVSYINDTTGERVVEYSQHDNTPLTTSTATWVPETSGQVSYGAINYDKYKIEVTTSNAVRQNTNISVQLFSTRPAIATDDFYFVNPQINIT